MTVPDMLTTQQVADKLQISAWTVYEWCRKGTLPHLRLNGSLRFSVPELEQWLKDNRGTVN